MSHPKLKELRIIIRAHSITVKTKLIHIHIQTYRERKFCAITLSFFVANLDCRMGLVD